MLLKELLLIRILSYKEYGIKELSTIMKADKNEIIKYIENINDSGFLIEFKNNVYKMNKSKSDSIVLLDTIHNKMIDYFTTLIEKKEVTNIEYYDNKLVLITIIPTKILTEDDILLVGKDKNNKEHIVNIDTIINY